ncbi:MAG: tRNA preQ1(34) S-adenosylmethionine ribosyltransferase-isomerase QueA [Bacteroidaceae bacterium]|nr:tRNA preQ1(34) S-adenosylmethionine ribosyltransferase-isomerase QueA [Candidatus Equimonas faecalis]MCQ2205310.1 tRNA preQ1(34) S-adenosylmethionine ribosyltransferase-isomerase QueA [Bacteroidaceae bacterium]
MKLSQFKFQLPHEQIAQHPADQRDESRMLVLHRKSGELEHKSFKDLLSYFSANDVFVLNDTKVFPARLYGNKERTGAVIEVFLLRELNAELRLWDVLVEPARKIRIGNKLYFGEDDSLVGEVIDNTTSRGRTLRFLYDGPHEEFLKTVRSLGEAPIPDYLERKSELRDLEDFQTVYARHEGGVTAPAAGLHFTRQTLMRMELADIRPAYLTLHCGLGNFRDTDVEDLFKHKIDSEQLIVDETCCQTVNRAKEGGHRVVAVGTTVQRGLESVAGPDFRIKPYDGWTNRFIFPPYDFKIATDMLVNFHQPYSTLLMLTTAFGGYEPTMRAYDAALKEGYRFGCYGDCMLITD